MDKPSANFLKNACYLIDASSFIFRAYYGLNIGLKSPSGIPTHATHGFISMMLNLIKNIDSGEIILLWDRPDKGLRHKIFPEYKANRGPPPEDLGIQIENSRKLCNLLGLKEWDSKGYEADDLIASIVSQNIEKKYVVCTGDKDLLCLVTENVWLWDTMKNKWSNRDQAFEKFGVMPDKITEVQALCGDSVDNIPGVPGVGPKTASQLINFYKNLEAVFQEATKRHPIGKQKFPREDPLRGKKVEYVAENIDSAKVSLKLVSLFKDVKIPAEYNDLSIQDCSKEEYYSKLEELGLEKILARSKKLFVEKNSVSANVPEIKPASENNKITFECITITSLLEFEQILNNNTSAATMCLDTETTGLDRFKEDTLVGISFCFDENKGHYLPLRHKDGNACKPEYAFQAIRALQIFLKYQHKDFSVVFQNAKFDLHILKSAGLEFPENLRIDDTMIASYVLNTEGKHNLDFLIKNYFDGYSMKPFSELVSKGETFADVVIDKASFYAVEDAVMTFKLWTELTRLLIEQGLWDVYDIIDRPLVEIITSMEREGISVEVKALEDLSVDLHKKLLDLEKECISSLTDSGVENAEDINLSSPKQIAVVLFEQLKLPVVKKTKTGASTDNSVLQELQGHHFFPSLLIQYRELSKLLSTYVDSLPKLVDSKTNKVHTSYSQIKTATGRLSSFYPNLQNIPIKTEVGMKIRKAFIAQKNNVLIGIDYSQMELRMLAEFCMDKGLIEAFKNNIDIHSHTASKVFKCDITDVTKEQRRIAKAINFGIVYGQTPFGLAKTINISRKQAKEFIDQYFENYPKIKEFMESLKAKAKEDGFVTTFTGRKRSLDFINSSNFVQRGLAERMAINTPIQGSAADLMKVAMIKVHKLLQSKYPKAKMILQVHDELIIELPKDIADEVAEKIKIIMEDQSIMASLAMKKFQVKIATDVQIGKSWSDI